MRSLENSNDWHDLGLPKHVIDVLKESRSMRFPKDRAEVLAMAMGGQLDGVFEVAYETRGRGRIVEATVTKCKNGLAVNYPEPYMRRRDPDCLVVGDNRPTDKPRYSERFGEPFDDRQIQETDKVRYSLTPNQHVGAWSVSFMPEWAAREYLGRRGIAKFPLEKLLPARCPLLGYALRSMQVEGTSFRSGYFKWSTNQRLGR